jgi:hypothetical protein
MQDTFITRASNHASFYIIMLVFGVMNVHSASDLVIVPNPSLPTARRTMPGTFFASHEPYARQWVLNDGAGFVFTFPVFIADPLEKISVEIAITRGSILSVPIQEAKNSDLLRDVSMPAAGTNYPIDIYWNGIDKKGALTEKGLYDVKAKITYSANSAHNMELSGTLLMGADDQSTSGISDSLGTSNRSSGCGNGFLLAFFPPLIFKGNRLFHRLKNHSRNNPC